MFALYIFLQYVPCPFSHTTDSHFVFLHTIVPPMPSSLLHSPSKSSLIFPDFATLLENCFVYSSPQNTPFPINLVPSKTPFAIVRLFLTSMSLVIFCLLFSSVDYVPVKSEIIRGRVKVGEGGGFSWGGVEGWGEKAYSCN